MQMIGVAVGSLRRVDELAPVLRSLGTRHAGYGVKDSHYDTVGSALLWTLEKGLGVEFTRETKDAWASAYSLLARMMKESAHAVTIAR